MLKKKANLYFFGLALLVIGLPVSEFLMSISIMILALAWLIDGPKSRQFNMFYRNKLAWSSVILFVVPLVSLLWTQNMGAGLHDLRIKLPLLLVPFLVAPFSINKKQYYILLGLLVGSTFVGSIILYVNYLIHLKGNISNIREASIFISHIRFSLIIDICIFILLYAAIQFRNVYSILCLAMSFWLIYFVFFLGSGNGFIGLVVIIVFGLIILMLKKSNRKVGIAAIGLLSAFILYTIALSITSYASHFIAKEDPYNNVKPKNKKGAGYYSKPRDFQLENGFYIYRNISNSELEREWKKVSQDKYYELDAKGQTINGTIVRYLTSKALPKDSVGIHQLTENDIRNIELGYYHFEQASWNNLKLRIDQFFYQMMAFQYKGDPGNKPFLQRLFYWKGALSLISENFWFGVGAGDLQDEFNAFFASELQSLNSDYWHHTHNQYLTYFVVAGVFAFFIFIGAVIYPFVLFIKRDWILAMAQLVLLISFISEDTLETQPGVTMYVVFIGLGIAYFNSKKNGVST